MQWSSRPIASASSIISLSHNLKWWSVSISSSATQWQPYCVILPHSPKLKSDKLLPEIRTAIFFFKLQTFFSSVVKISAQSFALCLFQVTGKLGIWEGWEVMSI